MFDSCQTAKGIGKSTTETEQANKYYQSVLLQDVIQNVKSVRTAIGYSSQNKAFTNPRLSVTSSFRELSKRHKDHHDLTMMMHRVPVFSFSPIQSLELDIALKGQQTVI